MPPAKNDIHTEFEQLSPKEYRCRYCAAPQKTADIVRLMRHIIICPCAPVNSKHSAGQLSREHAHSIENRKCRQVSTYHESSQTSLSLESCSSFCTQADLHHWIDTVTPNENKELNQQLADLIFSVGLPFSLVEHPKFIAFLHRLRPSYKAAHRTLLATRLLDNAYKDLRVQFDAQVIASPHGNARLTLISDGWTNIRGESIINYMLVRPDGAAYFHSSEPAGLSLHTGEFLAQQMTAVINDVGPHHINAICCDSAANQQNAVKRVQHRFPSIIGIKCTSHQLNLVIKDILTLPVFVDTLHKAVKLAKWFRNHQFVHEALKIQQKVFYKKEIALSLPVPTRWQSNLDCVMALINSQKAFESVVLIDTVETAMSKAGPKHHKARNAMSLIKSQDFWKCLKSMADVIRPFVQLIISFESNVPKLSTLYGSYLWLFKTAIELIPVEHRITVRDLLRARWSKMKSIEMEMASLLDVCLDAKYVVTLLDGRAVSGSC